MRGTSVEHDSCWLCVKWDCLASPGYESMLLYPVAAGARHSMQMHRVKEAILPCSKQYACLSARNIRAKEHEHAYTRCKFFIAR